jgi:hypothetical protein
MLSDEPICDGVHNRRDKQFFSGSFWLYNEDNKMKAGCNFEFFAVQTIAEPMAASPYFLQP